MAIATKARGGVLEIKERVAQLSEGSFISISYSLFKTCVACSNFSKKMRSNQNYQYSTTYINTFTKAAEPRLFQDERRGLD